MPVHLEALVPERRCRGEDLVEGLGEPDIAWRLAHGQGRAGIPAVVLTRQRELLLDDPMGHARRLPRPRRRASPKQASAGG